ncbi:MAG: hypothetical protein HXY18_03450 [Bryobacteraceae bacterium]|nr:hypothetical protein [Bryobacteraceae bacterium]
MRASVRRHRSESGFALLLVFAMAAAAVVLIYLELPRVAFENMRNKEEMLIERGEQYQRAIQLYVRKNNKYPQTIEDLETTNNTRFLRKRYKDPMTGEDEWRAVHIDNMGQYTDSLIHKKEEEKKKNPSVLASNIQGIGESAEYLPNSGQQGAQNPFAVARRQSEQKAQQGLQPGFGASPGVDPLRDSASPSPDPAQQNPGDPNQPRQQQPQFQPGQAPQDGSPFMQPPMPPGAPGVQTQVQQAPPGFGSPGGFGSSPGSQPMNRLPNFPSQGANSQMGGQLGAPIGASGVAAPPGLLTPRTAGGQQPGQTQSGGGFGFGGGFGMGSSGQTQGQPPAGASRGGTTGGMQSAFPSGQTPTTSGFGGSSFGGGSFGSPQPGQGAPNQAIQAIRGILSGGRPNQPQTAGAGAAIPGGIAGFASKLDMQSIKIYNERSNYKEWEFLFDMKKELEARGKKANPGTPQMGQGGPNQQNTTGFGSMGQQSPSSPGFGSSGGQTRPAPGGFGSSSSFGRQ